MGKVENWMEQLSKNSSFFQSSTYWLSDGGEAELEALVEKGRWCWWWWYGVGGGGGVGVKLVVGKKWRQKLQKLTLCTYSCMWCGERDKGPKVSNIEKLPSPNICLKRTAAGRRRTHKTKLRVISYQHFFNEYQPNMSKVGGKCK